MDAKVIVTKDDIKCGKRLIETKHVEEIKAAIQADLIDAEDIEDFGRFMFNDLKLVEVEYEEYISKIIGHYNHLYGTPEERTAAIAKNKIVRPTTADEKDIETEVLVCIAVILSINFSIVLSLLVVQMVLRRTSPMYFGSETFTWGVSFIILVGIGLSTYLIGYRNHLVRPYCRVGFKKKEEYQNWTENGKIKGYSFAFVLAILFFMLKQIVPGELPFFPTMLFDPFFFLLNSILACWPSKDESGYSLERHKRLNRNTLRTLILGEDVIEPPPTVPLAGPPVRTQIPAQPETGPTQQQLDAAEREFQGQMEMFNEEQEEYQGWKDSVPHGRKEEWDEYYRYEEERDDAYQMSQPGVRRPSGEPPPRRMERPSRRWPNVVPAIIQSGGGQAISGVGKFFYRFFYIIAIFMCQSVYTGLLVIALFHIVSREVSGSYSNLTHIGCTGLGV